MTATTDPPNADRRRDERTTDASVVDLAAAQSRAARSSEIDLPTTAGDPALVRDAAATRLDDAERRTLIAALDRILPSGEQPGALDAGCGEATIDILESLTLKTLAKMRHGLDYTDSIARQLFGRPFADAAPEERDRVLLEVQRTPHPTTRLFVHNLINLTLRTYLCHPRHGGNRGGVAWDALGVPLDEDPSCTTS